MFVLAAGRLAGEGFYRPRQGVSEQVRAEADQAGFPEERLSPIFVFWLVSSRLVPSRHVSREAAVSPIGQGVSKLADHKRCTTRQRRQGKACEMADVPGLEVAASNRDRGCKACCLVLYPAAAYACVRRRPVLGCTTLPLGTVVCTEECLSGLQGQPCLARADSMPPARMPNHSHGSISHSPTQSHLLLGSHPDQQYLRTTCRRPVVKLSECECERERVCVCVLRWVLGVVVPLAKEPLMDVLPLFGLCCILMNTQMLSGAAAPWRRQEMCVCVRVRACVRACLYTTYYVVRWV